MCSGNRTPSFESWLHHPPAVWLWGSHLTPLDLSLLFWKMGVHPLSSPQCWQSTFYVPGLVPSAGWHPALGKLSVVTTLGQPCSSGGICAHFLVWVSLSLIHFQPLMPALPACHCFAGFLTFFLQFSVELSENLLVWGKVANLLLVPVPVCHIWVPWGDVTLFSPLFLCLS